VTEQTDDEIADEELGGDELLLLMPGSWRELWQTPDRVCGLLEAAELGGFTAASALLDSWAWPDNRAELRRSGRRPGAVPGWTRSARPVCTLAVEVWNRHRLHAAPLF